MMMNQNFCSCYQKKIFKNGATLLCWMKVISKSHSMTANQFKLLSCSPPILDIVFRAHSGSSSPLPLSSNSIIWIRVGDYLHPLPKCQHGMQRWTVSDRILFLFYRSFYILLTTFSLQVCLHSPRFRIAGGAACLHTALRHQGSLAGKEISAALRWKYKQLWYGNTGNIKILAAWAPWNLRNQHEKGVRWTVHTYPGHSVKDSPKDVTSDNSWQNVLWTRHMRDPDQE